MKQVKIKALKLNLSVSDYLGSLAGFDIESDADDLKVIAERKDEPELNFEDLKKQLQQDGLI